MKHVKTISRHPVEAADIPISELMTFIISILNAIATLLTAKEATEA